MKISPSIFSFLTDIANNNNKVWFEENKPRYVEARKELLIFCEHVLQGLMIFDPLMREDANPYVFRIYRDARFARGIPYKNYFGLLFMKGGRSQMHERAGYYIHLEPGKCFIEAGAYTPIPKWLTAIREDISSNPMVLRSIINKKNFKKWGKLDGEKVKTSPQGYSKDHPEIDLLRHKSFFISHSITDEQVLDSQFDKYFVNVCKDAYPLNKYLNSIVY